MKRISEINRFKHWENKVKENPKVELTRNRILLLVATLIIIAVLSVLSFTPPKEVTVIRVIDGDTIEVEHYGVIRLKYIDTPEIDTPEGRATKRIVIDMLLNKKVVIKTDGERGYYDRLLAEVYINGLNLGQFLLDNNLAEPY